MIIENACTDPLNMNKYEAEEIDRLIEKNYTSPISKIVLSTYGINVILENGECFKISPTSEWGIHKLEYGFTNG